jgi:site-specific DNA-cytosine methylase
MSTNTNSSSNQNEPLILDGTRVDDIRIYDDGITPTLKNRMGTGGNNVPFVAQEAFVKSRRAQSPEDHETWVEGGPAPTLNAFDNGTESRATVVVPTVGFSHTQGLDAQPSEIAWPTLRSEGGGHAVAIPIQGTIIGRSDTAGPNGPGFGQEGDPMYTVDTISMHGVAVAYDEYNDTLGGDIHHSLRAGTRQSTGVVSPMSVRRLTPIECERLMGWPDNHTLHRADGKTNADTTRYKMCGNGVASPVAQWIAESINNIL